MEYIIAFIVSVIIFAVLAIPAVTWMVMDKENEGREWEGDEPTTYLGTMKEVVKELLFSWPLNIMVVISIGLLSTITHDSMYEKPRQRCSLLSVRQVVCKQSSKLIVASVMHV